MRILVVVGALWCVACFGQCTQAPHGRLLICQWHGAACACRPVREDEAVYATELPPTAFPAAL